MTNITEENKPKRARKVKTPAEPETAKAAKKPAAKTAKKPKKSIEATQKLSDSPDLAVDNVAEVEPEKTGKKKILFVSSEAAPFITTGGLGEVIGALPKSLYEASDDVDVRIVIPFYEHIMNKFKDNLESVGKIYVDLGWRHQYCGIYSTKVENVTYYFIDNEYYFKRADCYGFFDDGERFAFFGKAVLEILETIDFIPDVIHTHDWQSALVSIYLRTTYHWKKEFQDIKTVFTIHNMEYQGKYSMSILYDIFDIPYDYKKILEFDGEINLMKGAMMCSDVISTVSPSYAMEIHDYRYAYGLDPIVNMQSTKIRGILNGIDTASYNPADDKNIHERYDAGSIDKKSANKLQLQDSLRLPKEKDIPMICIITRLVKHKGIDLLIGAMNELAELPLQFVLLGKGDRDFESRFEYYQDRYPDKIRAVIDFDNRLSRIIYAAADFAIMPSKFEPCGITQMIASRYGTVPIVRETGGLKDSIKPYDGETDSGNGFTFVEYESEKVVEVVKKALDVYNNKDEWSKLTERVINWDFSWQKSAIEYLKMYDI